MGDRIRDTKLFAPSVSTSGRYPVPRTNQIIYGRTKVCWVGSTLSAYTFPPAMDLARSAADCPTSSRMFSAACSRVWDPGRPETELAAPRTASWFTSRRGKTRLGGIWVDWRKVWKDEEDEVERGRRKAEGARRRIDENIGENMVFLGGEKPRGRELPHYLYSCDQLRAT